MYFILAITICVLTSLYFILTRKYAYWKIKGVPYAEPSLLFGNYRDFIMMKKSMGQAAKDICKQFPDEPMVGAYYGTEPALLIKDPELVKLITTKDFYYFSSRELLGHTHKEALTKNVFNDGGDFWKVVRQNLTPLFSSAKMKNMFYLIEDRTKALERLLENEIKKSQVQEGRGLIARYTVDCIMNCFFGVQANTLEGEIGDNPYRHVADNIFLASYSRILKLIFRSMWPGIFYGLGFVAFPTEIFQFFENLTKKVFKDRNNTPSSRNDFLDLMLSLKQKGVVTGDGLRNSVNDSKEKVSISVDDNLIISQSLVLFSAGFETSALAGSHTLYELAKNEAIQNKALEEIDAYMKSHNGKLDYDCITLPYLGACLEESLRLHPVIGLVTREVVEDYTLPNGVKLDKGIRIHLPICYLHTDPKYFSNPKEYRPERFMPEERHKIVPYTYLPFGEGPRICIGMRFGKMQSIAGLVTVLKNFRVKLADNMPQNIDFKPKDLVTQSTYGIQLRFIPRHTTSSS